ncbi:BrnT family toxin [Tardiphaga sp. vice352]|uniref:BrnT family toxin n=1 Tax=unclassified Tardiphaga TaxID=2631404 RepID=UPI001161E8FE|nr:MULTISPECIES: BrnT family toxin [unclassified Tardiphaga]MBC7583439.1 BrnT family toxin [Tardiphaga sp.]QDM18240.1 BrnT family toxin [Tardiphaga sp. vice278]QDM23245.1 BrnT family toxin [Tardiphaga sp. vice154]QDM28466.1 BrnT family toxin [Tardiphaga sp. vice304]QDM33563.1 BrnT family toxin [Tardiphaga sp. vice352]
MKIVFDPAKRQAALDDRGLNFADAAILFDGPTITVEDTRRKYGETRYQTVGFLAGRMVMVVWTPRGEARHVMSMRKCNAREKAIYQKRFNQG